MSSRMRRVNESLRQVLSEAVPDLKDPRIGFVTVTGVETTSDLRQATVDLATARRGRARVVDRRQQRVREPDHPAFQLDDAGSGGLLDSLRVVDESNRRLVER